MRTLKYVLKRLLFLVITFFIIMTITFCLIKMLQVEIPLGPQGQIEKERREALGWNEPILTQYGIYLKNIFTKFDWGTSWKVSYMTPVAEVLFSRMMPTILVNVLSILIGLPLGIVLGIFAALLKNKWPDHVISVIIVLFISVPSFVLAFFLQYFLAFKLQWFPLVMSSVADAGGMFTWKMIYSIMLPVMAGAFYEIAYFARTVRAELTEALTSDYMLLARTKGLTKQKAIVRHALKNAMVPILPVIIGTFLSVLGGSMVLEQIFAIPGVGTLTLSSLTFRDYDLFVLTSMFYTLIGLSAAILTDLSYGFLDPRIKMGER
ncbi:MAG: ABC transporter permease [Christensenellaceae bacterium]|nr:ABC transporter permease [Christensenellaceae bacterium]